MSSTAPPTDTSDWDIDQQVPGAFPEPTPSGPPPALSTTQQSLTQAVYDRRAEYTEPRKIRIKIGSWNIASLHGSEKDIGRWFIDDDESRPDDFALYVLGLQEIVDISSLTEALRPTTDPAPANKIKTAIDEALPLGYELVAQEQLIGLLLLVYAHASIAHDVHGVSTTSIGTGLGGYMGNKGAVTARIILGETTKFVFINSHLAAGADKAALERRNWDAGNITSRTRFSSAADPSGVTQSTSEQIGNEDFAFWFGDLNYRLEGIPGDEVRRLLTLHTENKYGLQSDGAADAHGVESVSSEASSPQTPDDADMDPASLQATINSLMPHDELHQQMQAHKAFGNGWAEGPIRFLPTYKYDVGSIGRFDSSEKKRCPSWCDRILFRTKRRHDEYQRAKTEQENRQKAEEEAKANVTDKAGDDVLFNYEPAAEDQATKTDYDYDENNDVDEAGRDLADSEISLEWYRSHQDVLSSDHKPLSAVYNLHYNAVIAEAKQHVHAEVARELDRAENEGRPTVTVVVDKGGDHDSSTVSSESTDAGTIDFGKLTSGISKKRSMTIANTGRVPATLLFMDRPESSDAITPTPPWLTFQWDREPDASKSPKKGKSPPREYTLHPGDACSVDLVVCVEVPELIKSLNESHAQLDDIVILRVVNGRDHFLPVTARWVHSGVERSIEKLKSGVEGSLRKLQGQKVTSSGSGSSSKSVTTTAASIIASSRAHLVASPKPMGPE